MKVLVTGATGFIGGHVIRDLLKRNVQVITTSNDKEKAKSSEWFDKVKFVEFDVNNSQAHKENLFEYFGSPDKMIHLSWENLPNYKELFHFEKNLFSDYNFLKKVITDGLKDLTVAGTCLEYGMVNGCLDESMVTDPKNPYAIAKDTLRKFIEQLNIQNKFLFKWVRLFYIYGKGQSERSLYTQMEKAVDNNDTEFKMSGGEQLRDFLPVEKVAENITEISLQDSVTGIINCCSGKPQSVRKFVEAYFNSRQKEIKLVTGYYSYPDYEPFAFWGDNTKLNTVLNSAK
ncbi:MAG: NAD-dependent epimerase/dehydratase family protein [Ignavibacteria bacterium]